MFGSHRIRTEWDERLLTDGPDGLYQTLDSLEHGDVAIIEPVNPDGTSVAVAGVAGGALRLRPVLADIPAGDIPDADIFPAHQALVGYVKRSPGWIEALRASGRTFGSFGAPPQVVDYEDAGLTIATAMLDSTKRARRLGLPRQPSPAIRWGAREVITGDLWTDVPEVGSISLRVDHQDFDRPNGIAINVPGGQVDGPGLEPAGEMIIWPTAETASFEFSFRAPKRVIGVCNVYLSESGAGPIVDRWSENAGMLAERVSDTDRAYRCNHAAVAPPEFGDLSFTMSLN